jgi:hypothetical protein
MPNAQCPMPNAQCPMSKPIEVRNPRTGKYDYVIIPPPAKLLAQQCSRLRRAQKSWLQIGLQGE